MLHNSHHSINMFKLSAISNGMQRPLGIGELRGGGLGDWTMNSDFVRNYRKVTTGFIFIVSIIINFSNTSFLLTIMTVKKLQNWV
jgi:hypothetical protein